MSKSILDVTLSTWKEYYEVAPDYTMHESELNCCKGIATAIEENFLEGIPGEKEHKKWCLHFIEKVGTHDSCDCGARDWNEYRRQVIRGIEKKEGRNG